MTTKMRFACWAGLAAAAIGPAGTFAAEPFKVTPAAMPRIGTVDERLQSFNIEMVEVTGGRFWAPYKSQGSRPPDEPEARLSTPGIDPSLFRMRPPTDLANARLRRLAAALGPAYVRVSGTWANSTYFHDSDEAAPATPPAGFGGVLTRREWRGVIDFARAVNAQIVTSFAVSGGVRDADGVWTPEQARKLLAFTKASGGRIRAAELFNEPNFAAVGGAPKGYDAAAYGRDFKVFRAFVKQAAPDMLILGPGSVGEGTALAAGYPTLKSEDMLAAAGRGVDVFSYHFYGAVSKRCTGGMSAAPQSSAEMALSEEWLARTDRAAAFYTALRDRFEPGKPIWLTETGEAACGGDLWAAGFIDSFRYLDQLARLAKRGVQVVAHNTLAASDYALIDGDSLQPRPNYWAALLWRRLMGTTVLDGGVSPVAGVHLYAHCLRGQPGGVAVLAINADGQADHDLAVATEAARYTLAAEDLLGGKVELNGRELKLGAGDALPEINGVAAPRGQVKLPAASITFLAFPNAGNQSCR
jgi:heparanase